MTREIERTLCMQESVCVEGRKAKRRIARKHMGRIAYLPCARPLIHTHHPSVYPVLVEIVRVEADCVQLVGALERILLQHGYRTLRSFDLPLSTSANTAGACGACAERTPEGCICQYTVLIVLPRAGAGMAETIAVQGKGASSTLTLLTHDGDSELAAQFAQLLTEALHNSKDAERSDGAVGKPNA